MIFNGDLSKYHPADAIMFLSQLNLNGVFSVAEKQRLIALSFSSGFVIDAHSKQGDAKILQALIYQRRLTAEQVRHIRRAKAETGMPIRSILAQLNFFPLATVADLLLMGMQEVLLEMFLLDCGAFHFTDTPVDPDDADTRLDARMIAIRVAAQSDEFRDFEKNIAALDSELSFSDGTPGTDLSSEAKVILRMADGCRTIRELFLKAPFFSHTVMEIVKQQLEVGTLAAKQPVRDDNSTASDDHTDPVFGTFRQAMKKMMLAKEPLKKLEALVTYCRSFYDTMLILTCRDGELVHCQQMVRREGQGLLQQSKKGRFGRLDQDAGLLAVQRSGVGFFGERFPSKLLDDLTGAPADGECALIPVLTQGAVSILLYVYRQERFSGLSPQHYLEMLSWMATAGNQPGEVAAADGGVRVSRHSDVQVPPNEQSIPDKLIASIDDLPPLPTLVTRALDLLNDPGADAKEVEAVIGKDQSLVSKLIRVSNSALYGGKQRVESLQQALTRLGAKTIKSLILAASMQGYFLKTNPGALTWGQSLWQHAAEVGMAARRIAVAVGHDDPEQAFVGGVVHDIGKLVILLAGDDAYRQIQNMKRRETIAERDAEIRVLGTDHTAVGVQLMEKWKMPSSARLCTRYHHHVDDAAENKPLVAVAAYANHLSHLYGAQAQPATPERQAAIDRVIGYLGLSQQSIQALIESVNTDFQEASLLA
jgi:HD-like signal output (HDOD) protein